MEQPPQFIIIGGGNGSGKSTSAALVVPGVIPYINADEIAKAYRKSRARTKTCEPAAFSSMRWKNMKPNGRTLP
jgi:predicted ABC-type ATPase